MWETVTTFVANNSTNGLNNTQVTDNRKNTLNFFVNGEEPMLVLGELIREVTRSSNQAQLDPEIFRRKLREQGCSSDDEFGSVWVKFEKHLKAYQNLIVYLELEASREDIAESITFKSVDEFTKRYDRTNYKKAMEVFSKNLSDCLGWLYESLKTGDYYSIGNELKDKLKSFRRELYQGAFHELEEKIRDEFGDSNSEEIKILQIYTQILFRQIW